MANEQVQNQLQATSRASEVFPVYVEAFDSGKPEYIIVSEKRTTSDGAQQGNQRMRVPPNVRVYVGSKLWERRGETSNGLEYVGVVSDVDKNRHHPLKIYYSELDVSNPPTDAELDAGLGPVPAAPTVQDKAACYFINDNGAGTNYFLVISDGTKWVTFTGTIAT